MLSTKALSFGRKAYLFSRRHRCVEVEGHEVARRNTAAKIQGQEKLCFGLEPHSDVQPNFRADPLNRRYVYIVPGNEV